MGDATILGLQAFGYGNVAAHWWQWIIIAILCASVTIGLLVTAVHIVRSLREYFSNKKLVAPLPRRVLSRLNNHVNARRPAQPSRPPLAQPKTFGAYYGPLSLPPTRPESKLFSRYDIVILDLREDVVRGVVEGDFATPPRVIGRVDLSQLLAPASMSDEVHMSMAVDQIMGAVDLACKDPNARRIFNGILLSGWRDKISVQLLDAITGAIKDLAIEVYLEIEPPNFLEGIKLPAFENLAGVVVRNGTMMPNGTVRDFFQLQNMKSTVKAFVSQACLRPFNVMVLDVFDDGVELSHAVIRRSYTWTGYSGAMGWIGSRTALVNASKNSSVIEPLSAFQWLKDNHIVKVHETFRTTRTLTPLPTTTAEPYDAFAQVFPSARNLATALENAEVPSSKAVSLLTDSTLAYPSDQARNSDGGLDSNRTSVVLSGEPEWISQVQVNSFDPLSGSPHGTTYTGLGCFPIGVDISLKAYKQVLESQRRLRRLYLLNRVPANEVQAMAQQLKQLTESDARIPKVLKQNIRTFCDLANQTSDEEPHNDPLQIYLGLDSGFRAPGNKQLWSCYETDRSMGALILYISKSSLDIPSTVLHTFLSSCAVPRHQCFLAENALHEIAMNSASNAISAKTRPSLPERVEQDLSSLTPENILLLLQQFKFSNKAKESAQFLSAITAACEDYLMDAPSFKQMKKVGSFDYLSGAVDVDVVASRVTWYRQHGWAHLDQDQSLELFREVQRVYLKILQEQRYDDLDIITKALCELFSSGQHFDCYADFLAFSIFCAARKYAFDEVYIEVTDRNPLFNEFSDQSAAMAELFALGSRCDAYFDVTPSAFGKLLSGRYRAHYSQKGNQPPIQIGNAEAFFSSYAAANTDIDPDQRTESVPAYRRFTFLGVFAIPALGDIVLLTTTGRGLYLSAFMSKSEQQYATTALMISLLLSGAIGTWISIGGTYYLISMAFSASNMFVLTRLMGGLSFTVLGGIVGFIIISAVDNVQSGAIFFFYLVGLTAYLSILAALCSFQFPGSTFLNGRTNVLIVIPILLISPLITTWVHGHDAMIYLIVVYIFLFALIYGLRSIGGKWVTWTSRIKTVDDAKVKAWYKARFPGEKDPFAGLSDPAAMSVSRKMLADAVENERSKRFWEKGTTDELVRDLAGCWESTLFLLDWYCRLSDVKRPMPYSSTWNIEVRVAYDSLLQNQKGIRMHNSFVHWRNAGDEIGAGILYFIVALLDRWIDLLYGSAPLGLSRAENDTYRMAVGFGLAYYLIGAVLLDYKAQHLHTASADTVPLTIKDENMIRQAKKMDAKRKQYLYWRTLARFGGVHVWALAISTACLFILDGGSSDGLIMFLTYVGSYTGLLLYQYNKIFSGPHALSPLLAAVCVGFPIGLVLKRFNPLFAYNGTIALAIATWTAAVISIKTAKIGLPKKSKFPRLASNGAFHSYSTFGEDHEWSQPELAALYEDLVSQPKRFRIFLTPMNHPGNEVKAVLSECTYSSLPQDALDAFPEAPHWTEKILRAWESGKLNVELVPITKLTGHESQIRAISRFSEGYLHLLVAMGDDNAISGRAVAETMLRACATNWFGMNRYHAGIAESLLTSKPADGGDLRVSENLQRDVPMHLSSSELLDLAELARADLIRNLCLGYSPDVSWDDMEQRLREVLLRRALGDSYIMTADVSCLLNSHFISNHAYNLNTEVSRYDYGATNSMHVYNYLKARSLATHTKDMSAHKPTYTTRFIQTYDVRRHWLVAGLMPFAWVLHALGRIAKFLVIATMGDPEFHRELSCVLSGKPAVIRKPCTWALTGIWMYSRFFQSLVLPWFLTAERPQLKALWDQVKGTKVTLKPGRLVVQEHDKASTAFIHRESGPSKGFALHYYDGTHKTEPESSKVIKITFYSGNMRLLSRVDYNKGEVVNEYEYHYGSKKPSRLSKLTRPGNPGLPLTRRCVRGQDKSAEAHYNPKGFIESGSYLLHGNLIRFKYRYRKNAGTEDELLRAEFVLPHISVNVSWAAPPVRHPEKEERWIPHSRVNEATFVIGPDVFESSWTWNHNFNPTITTVLNGQSSETPDIIKYDWLGLLKKPTNCSFRGVDNPLLNFRNVEASLFRRLFHLNSVRLPTSTGRARSQLWRAWKKSTLYDGVVMQWLDERILRTDPILRSYWRRRDRGSLISAEDYLALHADSIMASADLSSDIAAWTPLAIRLSDLFSFGQGGDAVVYTRTKTLQPDTEDTMHVVAVDTGTWPNEGGGVSACRRDMINNLRTVRWNMVVESANDFGLPKHQTEENVDSLKVIPLWGLDFMQPVHGMFFNKLDSEVDIEIKGATKKDIYLNFIPTLTTLIKGARAIELTQADIKQSTRALVNLNTYFQDSRHWKEVWTSDLVKDQWRALWLADDLPNTKPPSTWFDTECPTLGHLDMALEMWFRYLFIFSIPIPEKIPSVFQASHHSVSAAYGIVCKVKRNCTLQIWDHAISWRETNLYLSSALCTMPPFIRNSLLALMRLTSTLILHHADNILPCADFFNPGWELEIGTSQGRLEHRNAFKRKIDPVVNGITDMQKFKPVTEIKSKKPTVTMLSHVWFAKDIKTALLAADIIVNQWGFKEYQLDIYGALNKAPIYSSECQEVIATKGIGTNVSLKGTADPGMVLEQTWVFLNSSVSEGLPLALGEAALTGAPVVCTDVGASMRVLTDPETGEKYSEIVAPNDPLSLARAQINILAMIDQWTKYAEDAPGETAPVLPVHPTARDVEIITKRMYEKSSQRKALGMRARDIVQNSFSGERYLREHEQMLWVGRSTHEMLELAPKPRTSEERNKKKWQAREEKDQLDKMAHPRPPWLKHRDSAATSFTSAYGSSGTRSRNSTFTPGGYDKLGGSTNPSSAGESTRVSFSYSGKSTPRPGSVQAFDQAFEMATMHTNHGHSRSASRDRSPLASPLGSPGLGSPMGLSTRSASPSRARSPLGMSQPGTRSPSPAAASDPFLHPDEAAQSPGENLSPLPKAPKSGKSRGVSWQFPENMTARHEKLMRMTEGRGGYRKSGLREMQIIENEGGGSAETLEDYDEYNRGGRQKKGGYFGYQ